MCVRLCVSGNPLFLSLSRSPLIRLLLASTHRVKGGEKRDTWIHEREKNTTQRERRKSESDRSVRQHTPSSLRYSVSQMCTCHCVLKRERERAVLSVFLFPLEWFFTITKVATRHPSVREVERHFHWYQWSNEHGEREGEGGWRRGRDGVTAAAREVTGEETPPPGSRMSITQADDFVTHASSISSEHWRHWSERRVARKRDQNCHQEGPESRWFETLTDQRFSWWVTRWKQFIQSPSLRCVFVYHTPLVCGCTAGEGASGKFNYRNLSQTSGQRDINSMTGDAEKERERERVTSALTCCIEGNEKVVLISWIIFHVHCESLTWTVTLSLNSVFINKCSCVSMYVCLIEVIAPLKWERERGRKWISTFT